MKGLMMSKKNLEVFSQFHYIDLEKADDNETLIKIDGIASSEAVDNSGEIIRQSGLDWEYCLKTGSFNLDHMNDPKNILGAPTEIYQTTIDGVKATGIRGFLYNSKEIVKDIIETAKAMSKSGLRKMGLSIEGQVIERDRNNPNIITKAKVLNVSITSNPCNQTATFELVKNILSDIESKEKDNMEKSLAEKYVSKLEELFVSFGEEYHAKKIEDMKQEEITPADIPSIDDDDTYQTNDKPYIQKDSEVGYQTPAQPDGNIGHLVVESLEGDKSSKDYENNNDSDDDEDILSDEEIKRLVIAILKEFPEITNEKVMSYMHNYLPNSYK
jgi:hypothetical protein